MFNKPNIMASENQNQVVMKKKMVFYILVLLRLFIWIIIFKINSFKLLLIVDCWI